jgi:hypothetical protein
VRLRTCIALELATAAGLLGASSIGGYLAVREISGEFSREAMAAEGENAPPIEQRVVAPPPVSPPTELRIVRRASGGRFEGTPDEVLLAPLREGVIKKIKFNRGGSSLSLRMDFADGARAAFKPRQINLQTVPRREVAAFRINRLLGLSSVPPAIGRRFKADELLAALAPEHSGYLPRLQAEMVVEDGYVVGELSWWIPVIARGFVGGYELDSTDGIVTWKRLLKVGTPIPEADRRLVAQISEMLLFDFVINNSDRWSGGNARVSEDGQMLYFMDNTLSFGDSDVGHSKVRTYLERSQKFSRALVARLRRLNESELRRSLSGDLEGFEFLLEEDEIAAVMSRRAAALEYIDELIAQHGEAAVLVFP